MRLGKSIEDTRNETKDVIEKMDEHTYQIFSEEKFRECNRAIELITHIQELIRANPESPAHLSEDSVVTHSDKSSGHDDSSESPRSEAYEELQKDFTHRIPLTPRGGH